MSIPGMASLGALNPFSAGGDSGVQGPAGQGSPFSGLLDGAGLQQQQQQQDPLAQLGLQSMSPDTQMLFMSLQGMMVGLMGMIATTLAGILSGAISGTAPPGSNGAGASQAGQSTGGGTTGGGTTGASGPGAVTNNPQQTANGTFTLPLPDPKFFEGRSPFGAPRDGGSRSHKGNDFMAPTGTPVLAIAEGEIIRSVAVDDGNNAGIRIGIRHPDGTESFYYHLNEVGINPETGQPYKEGDHIGSGHQLGTVGDTGNAKGTPHLHFEVKPPGGEQVDPWEYFLRDLLGK